GGQDHEVARDVRGEQTSEGEEADGVDGTRGRAQDRRQQHIEPVTRHAFQRSNDAPGMFRRLDRAISIIFPTPPLRTTFVAASAKPAICVLVMWGGIESAFESVTRSTRAGPGWFSASSSPARMSFGCSIRIA